MSDGPRDKRSGRGAGGGPEQGWRSGTCRRPAGGLDGLAVLLFSRVSGLPTTKAQRAAVVGPGPGTDRPSSRGPSSRGPSGRESSAHLP